MVRKVLILVLVTLVSCNKMMESGDSTTVYHFEDGVDEIIKYDDDGDTISINYQEDGIREGAFFEFYKTGLVRRISSYKQGKKQGEDFIYFDSLNNTKTEVKVKVLDLIKSTPSKYSIYDEGKLLYYISFKKNRELIEEAGSRFIGGNFRDNEVIPCDNRKVAFWHRLAYPFVITMSVKKKHTYSQSEEQYLQEFHFIHHDDEMYLQDSLDLTQEQEISYIVSFKPDNSSVLLDTLTLYIKCDN